MNQLKLSLLLLIIFSGCKQKDVSQEDLAFEALVQSNADMGFETVTKKNADVILRCESIVSETSSGITVNYKPIKTLKGKISGDMLGDDGLLVLTKEYGNDVKVPKYYLLYLRKEKLDVNWPETVPFSSRYDFTLMKDD